MSQPAGDQEHGLPCDRRYRTNQYFLEDQLRCSEAISDFRSVREFISKTQAFNFKRAFQFQTQPVFVRNNDA